MRSFLSNILLRILFYPAPRPIFNKEEEKIFNEIFKEARQKPDKLIDYNVSIPKYKFLQYLSDTKPILFHGSNHKEINSFEPREQTLFNGVMTKAVFATKDPIWSNFFAILRKGSVVDNFRNGAISANDKQWYHYYSLTKANFLNEPWTNGVIYILPMDSFIPPSKGTIQFNEWISKEPVSPIAKLEVMPSDFYFIDNVTCHKSTETVSKTWLFYKIRSKFKKFK
ncbi:MAG TPA: hypothetical protein VEV44_16580 [Pseudoneobacillus sp.]|nr:hypothetical protein [Pseudoneobacillus sp.]